MDARLHLYTILQRWEIVSNPFTTPVVTLRPCLWVVFSQSAGRVHGS